ncbi:glycosyltransferase [Chloroflexota bacterium]
MYLLVTRVRDEEDYLPELFQSVFSQTVRPNLWVIVDHGSKDDSAAIIARAIEGKNWIKVVHMEAAGTYDLLCHARPLKAGFEAAVNHAIRNGIPYHYLGILDADIVPEEAYFEKLIQHLKNSPGLGIVSGQLFVEAEDGQRAEGAANVPPRGGCRLYRRECFEDIGGTMPESAIWDTETDVLSELRGWQIAMFTGARGIHKRVTYSRKGKLRGCLRLGKCYYYANYHPVYVLITGLYFTSKLPFITGPLFLFAYLKSWLQRSEQSANPVIRECFWKSPERLKKKAKAKIISILGRRV